MQERAVYWCNESCREDPEIKAARFGFVSSSSYVQTLLYTEKHLKSLSKLFKGIVQPKIKLLAFFPQPLI